MATRKRKKGKSAGPRASWKGTLGFGLVSVAVEAFNAIDREQSDIRFHQLHATCHRRIQYQKVCPTHGEVSNDEIVSGYEYKKDTYAEVDPDELEALRSEAPHTLKVDAFITPNTIDPLYFDGRMYYLLPADESAEEAYAVFVEAMQREEMYAVGQIILSGKSQLALVRPYEDVLHMALLNYAAEIRPASAIAKVPTLPKGVSRQVNLARTLIQEWTNDRFEFADYEDDYREQVEKLIKAKIAGKQIAKPKESAPPTDVINLMEALKQSLAKSSKKAPARSERTRKRKRSA